MKGGMFTFGKDKAAEDNDKEEDKRAESGGRDEAAPHPASQPEQRNRHLVGQQKDEPENEEPAEPCMRQCQSSAEGQMPTPGAHLENDVKGGTWLLQRDHSTSSISLRNEALNPSPQS